MIKGNRYLVMYGSSARDREIKEWNCLEVAETAYKVENRIKVTSFLSYDSTAPFWVLKTDIDTIGQTEYKIIEDLGEYRESLIKGSITSSETATGK